jgi:hypothetical protein
MISFDAGTHRFNLRAAAVIFQGAYVLQHRVDGDDFWSLPGGRVEPGEDAAKTAIREMLEERSEPRFRSIRCSASSRISFPIKGKKIMRSVFTLPRAWCPGRRC